MSQSQNQVAMQTHIPQWRASGLNQADYCKTHDIKPHIFSDYKKKFSSANSPVQQVNQLVPVKFVAEGNLGSSGLSSDSLLVKVTHTNGFSLEIQTDTELSTLKPLLELVRSIS